MSSATHGREHRDNNSRRGVTVLMVTVYILWCIVIRTRPCKVFQLNARFFDADAGIFSKITIDRLLPPAWRLAQRYDSATVSPDRYPVFLKPEWSQNARGVHRADNADDLRRIRATIAADAADRHDDGDDDRHGDGNDDRHDDGNDNRHRIRYLVQDAAPEKNEYEIFWVRHHRSDDQPAVLTITHARNESEAYPVNGVYNPATRYVEITESFTAAQQKTVWKLMQRIGAFSIARVSVRADSTDDLLRGKFHIIEVNLFLPMPINLLDDRYTRMKIFRFVVNCMRCLARATKHRDRNTPTRPVFIKSMLYNREHRWLNFWRAKL